MEPAWAGRLEWLLPWASGAAITLGVYLRFRAPSALWLDEALSVNIAELPIGAIPEALRHDGSPPLYYVLLHVWMLVFGGGDLAVRAFSGVLGVASIPLAFMAGARLGGRRMGWTAVLLLASSPIAVRYSTETRMYSLIIFLSLIGFLALHQALARPALVPLMVVAVASGMLLLTHYWAIYLVAVVALGLALRWRRTQGPDRDASRLALIAVASGGLFFLWWVPSFLEQLVSTGTPWGAPTRLVAMFDVLGDFTGGFDGFARSLLTMSMLLAALGLFGRAVDARRIELDLRGTPPGRWLTLATFGTLAVG
ncbi:MAG: glycosyltransferase family 39 protein, partial [Acidimicrobiia bacterium]